MTKKFLDNKILPNFCRNDNKNFSLWLCYYIGLLLVIYTLLSQQQYCHINNGMGAGRGWVYVYGRFDRPDHWPLTNPRPPPPLHQPPLKVVKSLIELHTYLLPGALRQGDNLSINSYMGFVESFTASANYPCRFCKMNRPHPHCSEIEYIAQVKTCLFHGKSVDSNIILPSCSPPPHKSRAEKQNVREIKTRSRSVSFIKNWSKSNRSRSQSQLGLRYEYDC